MLKSDAHSRRMYVFTSGFECVGYICTIKQVCKPNYQKTNSLTFFNIYSAMGPSTKLYNYCV